MRNVSQQPELSNQFYQTYFMLILSEVIGVTTDTMHKSGFHLQCQVLLQLFKVVETRMLIAPVALSSSVASSSVEENKSFIGNYLCQLLHSKFGHLNSEVLIAFVNGLFTCCGDERIFMGHVHDFRIKLKGFQMSDGISQDS